MYRCGCEYKLIGPPACLDCKVGQLCVRAMKTPMDRRPEYSCADAPADCKPLSCACFADGRNPNPCPDGMVCGTLQGERIVCGRP
jgi:hypothetical protein